MPNSRQKGKRGELEIARILRDYGYRDCRRGQQYSGGKWRCRCGWPSWDTYRGKTERDLISMLRLTRQRRIPKEMFSQWLCTARMTANGW